MMILLAVSTFASSQECKITESKALESDSGYLAYLSQKCGSDGLLVDQCKFVAGGARVFIGSCYVAKKNQETNEWEKTHYRNFTPKSCARNFQRMIKNNECK